MTSEKLHDFFNAPGLADAQTIREVYEFLTKLEEMLTIFRRVRGEAIGESVLANRDIVERIAALKGVDLH